MRNFSSGNRGGGFSSERRGSFGGGSRFGGRDGGDRRGGFGGRGGGRSFGRSDGPVEMHDAICSNCGNKCKVPFKPTGEKPVFCSDCFRQREGSDNSRGSARSDASSQQMTQINAKLDKILAVLQELEIHVEEVEGDADEDAEKVEAEAGASL